MNNNLKRALTSRQMQMIAILISHMNFRKREQIKDHPFKMPFAPVSNIITIIMIVLVVIGMLFNAETRISVMIVSTFLIGKNIS
ncbi:hypothetical protein [Mammaliicoccus sciuri]|uniref:hypothetical protein n=1 Tax=Mammaliicoccus sciuri TaxID=1296 RepID=UPI00374E0C13